MILSAFKETKDNSLPKKTDIKELIKQNNKKLIREKEMKYGFIFSEEDSKEVEHLVTFPANISKKAVSITLRIEESKKDNKEIKSFQKNPFNSNPSIGIKEKIRKHFLNAKLYF